MRHPESPNVNKDVNVAYEMLCRHPRCKCMRKVARTASGIERMECGHEVVRPKSVSQSQWNKYTQPQYCKDEEERAAVNEFFTERVFMRGNV